MVRMMMTTRSVGEVSSKYGYQPEKFTEDIQRKAEESEKLYNEFKEWMKEKNIDPREFRLLFRAYYEEFIE